MRPCYPLGPSADGRARGDVRAHGAAIARRTAVEELTGRTVLAAMTANNIDPDLNCQLLVLTPASAGAGPRRRGGAPDG
jgi:hypothetical protein